MVIGFPSMLWSLFAASFADTIKKKNLNCKIFTHEIIKKLSVFFTWEHSRLAHYTTTISMKLLLALKNPSGTLKCLSLFVYGIY